MAQLIHEPERPEVDSSRLAIEKGMGYVFRPRRYYKSCLWVYSDENEECCKYEMRRTAIEQFTRLKNISNRLATPDSEFTVSPVDAPPPDPLEFENVVMAAYQSRKNVC